MLKRYGGILLIAGVFLTFISGLVICGAHTLSQLEKSFTIEEQIVWL